MNKTTKTIVNFIAGIGLFIALGIAGSLDMRESVIGSISNELYQKILYDLGGSATEKEIYAKYIADKQAYDALGI